MCLRWAAILWLILFPVYSVQADQLIVNKVNYTAATIIALDQGRLRFRTADGRSLEAWIDEIELIMVDRGSAFTDFNQAERFLASGEAEKAVVRYQRSLRLSEDYWSQLVSARMLIAADRAGQLDKAVKAFIRLVREGESGAVLATRIFPQTIPVNRRGRLMSAIKQLDHTLTLNLNTSQRAVIALLRYDLLRRTNDDRATQAAIDILQLAIPKPVRVASVYDRIEKAVSSVIARGDTQAALEGLDRAIRYSPKSKLPGLLLLKGRALFDSADSQEAYNRACRPFLRVVIHFPDDPLAPQGLYQAAEVLHRMGRADQAVDLLQECLQHKRLDSNTRQLAESALEQWPSARSTPG